MHVDRLKQVFSKLHQLEMMLKRTNLNSKLMKNEKKKKQACLTYGSNILQIKGQITKIKLICSSNNSDFF